MYVCEWDPKIEKKKAILRETDQNLNEGERPSLVQGKSAILGSL
jgi:hypothetical protein